MWSLVSASHMAMSVRGAEELSGAGAEGPAPKGSLRSASGNANDAKPSGSEVTVPDVPSLGSLLWDVGATVRTWAGYKDNPQLAAVAPAESALFAGGGDVFVSRLPGDGRELTVYGMFERTEYLASDVAPESMGIVDVRGRRIWEGGWFVGGIAEYLYFRQVFDASDITGLRAVLRAEGHMGLLRPGVGYEWDSGWKVEAELEGSRQWLAAPLDDYWDGGTRVTGTRSLGKQGSVALSYRFRDRRFDERIRTDSSGMATTGLLRFAQHETELVWRRDWDARRRWRTVLKAGWLYNLDNGEGYFEYHRAQISAGLRYVRETWELKGEIRARGYWYPIQIAELGSSSKLERSDLGGTIRAQVRIRKGLRVFAQFEHEVSESNQASTDYNVESTWLGLELEYER